MILPTLLAQISDEDEATTVGLSEFVKRLTTQLDILHHPEMLLDSLDNIPFVAGSILMVVGLLCVFNGYRWHRWVLVILAFLAGVSLGGMLGERFGESRVVAVALGLLCAIIATPLEKIAVAIFGGLTGAFIGSNVWTALSDTSPQLHWAGAAMGFIALALTSVILFRLVIVLFTSVGGAAMVVFGGITLLLQVEGWAPTIRNSLSSNQLLLPVLVCLAAVGGFVLQESRARAAAASSGAEE
jgi:hypothetical protein